MVGATRVATVLEKHRSLPVGFAALGLACGIASSVLYALMIWAIRYEGYSLISRVPSEPSAIGAPTRALWVQLGWIYTVLETSFGFGVWHSAGRNRALRIV